MIEIESTGVPDTLSAGRRLAGLLRPGDIVLLNGRLGCGKTLFTSGVAEGLGIDGPIPSPSFLLVRSYRGFLPLIHADAYRLGTTGEFEDLAIEEQLDESVLIVEWGQAIVGSVRDDRLDVEFEITGPESRTLRFVPHGSWSRRPIQAVAA